MHRYGQTCLNLRDKNLLNKTFGNHYFSDDTLQIYVFNLILPDWWYTYG